ncbi:DNA polymerase III subunit delta [Desulfovibrio psychrotolerans]|uniref:DNA-directed DNA polymerase n=1 Tax=Desulfovibrio psychrotolerans TaxID=415242 RepID=A0A7J0BUL0_9BACT|nr:DNA polymerase III subunit delta [Desulfovibrio psychrotolerans]GFM37383.1 DNA polymerase III subunit delta [Desulfovibrio psychrotolerans]
MPHTTRPGFSICVCPDAQLIKEQVESLLAAHPAAEGPWQRHAYWGDEGLPAVFWENLTLQGLFAAPKCLVVRNAQNLATDDWKKLSQTLGRFNPLAWAFLCMEVPFEKGGPKVAKAVSSLQCWTFADKQGWIWTSPGLTPQTMRGFASAWATRNGVTILPPVLQTLSHKLPPDATAATRELEKLALAAGDSRTITAEIAADLSHEPEMDVFAFINALQNAGSGQTGGNASLHKVWHKVMHSQAGGEEMVFPFLAMLLREARLLWQLLAGEQAFLPGNVKQAKERLARSLGRARLCRIWDLALEADKGIKTGERRPEQAMELLVAGLIALFSPPSDPRKPSQSRSSTHFR